MKVLHIIWSLLNGGTENMLCDIINYQVKSEKVTLLVVNDMVDESIIHRLDKRCKVVTLLRPKGTKNPYYVLRMNAMILFNHYDIVHLHNANMINYLFVKANYVRTVHNTKQHIHNYRWHKSIIAISESVKQELKEKGYSNSILINNGVNFDLISTKKRTSQQNDVFKMVQVSRIMFSQKGQDIMLDIIAKVIDKGYSAIHVDFIGDGEDLDILKKLVAKKHLQNYVTLLGNKSREYIYKHLCDYDLLVQPSRFEGFGLTVAEAMAAKIPVLVSKNEGPLQIIEGGTYGSYFENGNVNDAVDKIIGILKKYPSETFLNDAFLHVKNLYGVKRTAEQYLKVYRSIVC